MKWSLLFEKIDPEMTKARYGDQIKHRLDQERSSMTLDDAIIFFVSSDPTPNKQYVLWMIRLYLKQGIQRIEDLSRTGHALQIFHKHKQKMPIKDIGKIKTLSDLEDMVESFEAEKTSNELKREDSEEIKKETKIIYNGEHGKILIPLTEKSSCFWGRGTRWCTAATSSKNYFNDYDEQGPLIIILPKDGTKWQLHFQSASLMDSKDKPISIVEFNSKYPEMVEIIKSKHNLEELVQSFPDWIHVMENPSEKIQLIAVEENGDSIQYISNPTEKVQLAAVDQKPFAIKHLHNPSIAVQLKAVSKKGEAIRFIANPSEEVQLEAVENSSAALTWIPHPSEKVQIESIIKHPETFRLIRDPKERVQIIAVKADPKNIRYILDPSENVQIAVLEKDPKAIYTFKPTTDKVKRFSQEQMQSIRLMKQAA